jgi:hypothetical protein
MRKLFRTDMKKIENLMIRSDTVKLAWNIKLKPISLIFNGKGFRVQRIDPHECG